LKFKQTSRPYLERLFQEVKKWNGRLGNCLECEKAYRFLSNLKLFWDNDKD
jgi:hypothetical protein